MPFTKTLHFLMDYGALKLNSNTLILAEADTQNIAKQSQVTAQKVASYFNDGWSEIINHQSHIYNATVSASLLLATIFVCFWAVPWVKTAVQEGYSTKTIDELLPPLIVIFALAVNQGVLPATVGLVMRNTTNYIDAQILQETFNGIKVEEAIRKVNMNEAHRQMLWEKYDQCRQLSKSDKNEQGVGLQDACIEEAIREVNKEFEKFQEGEEGLKFDGNIGAMVTKAVKAFNSEIENLIRIFLAAFQAAFVLLIEIVAILNVYISPLFFALSLLPGQIRLIHAWFAGWLSLGLMKVSFTIIVGISATAVAKNNSDSLLWLPILQAIFSPILAVAIAAGGGIALFNGLGSIGSGGIRAVMKSGMSRRRQ